MFKIKSYSATPYRPGCKSYSMSIADSSDQVVLGRKKKTLFFSSSHPHHHRHRSPENLGVSYRKVKPFDRVKSTPFFSCSSVRKIKIVVGCSRIQAGTQPLNMNIAPSFLSEDLITPSVDWHKIK